MKRFGVAILLATLGLTTACPQAAQVLSPATFSSGNSKGNESTGGDVIVARDEAEPVVVADQTPTPIQPKSDSGDVPNLKRDVRLRYGAPQFASLLDPEIPADSAALPKLELPPNGAIHFQAAVEARNPFMAFSHYEAPVGFAVRMTYRSDADPNHVVYCDALVSDPGADNGNIQFSEVNADKGVLSFYLRKISEDKVKDDPSVDTDDFSACSAGWKPVLKEDSLGKQWTPLGSLRTEPSLPLKFITR